MNSEKWDLKFIELAKHISGWSKDKNTKVGAVIVNDSNRIISTGYNGFVIGANDSIESRYEKGLGSALTYAERYFLLKYFHINTDEDDIDNPERKKDIVTMQKPKAEKTPILDMAKLQELLKTNKEATLKQLATSKYLTKEQVKNLGLKDEDLIGVEIR